MDQNLFTNVVAEQKTALSLALLAVYMIYASLLTYALFRADRVRAMTGDTRVPEGLLVVMAILGGWPGAKAAQIRYHHKARKQPFATIVNLVSVGQIILAIGFAVQMSDLPRKTVEWIGGSEMAVLSEPERDTVRG